MPQLNLSEEMVEVTMRCVQSAVRGEFEFRSSEEPGDPWDADDWVDERECLRFWVEAWGETSKFPERS